MVACRCPCRCLAIIHIVVFACCEFVPCCTGGVSTFASCTLYITMDIFGYGVIFASKIFPLCSTYTFKSHCTHVHLLQIVNRCHGQLAHYHRSNIHCIDYLKLALCIMFDLMAYMDCHLLHSLRRIYQHSISPKYFFGSHPNSQTAFVHSISSRLSCHRLWMSLVLSLRI